MARASLQAIDTFRNKTLFIYKSLYQEIKIFFKES